MATRLLLGIAKGVSFGLFLLFGDTGAGGVAFTSGVGVGAVGADERGIPVLGTDERPS